MRTKTSFFAALALSAAFASPAAAQTVATAYTRSTVVEKAAPAEAPVIRTIAIYRFSASRILRLPTTITVSDSAGQLVANFKLPNESNPGVMSVEVMGNDIILQGETPRGLLTLVLYRQNAADVPSTFVGYWSLGDEERGELRGRTTN
ncbi:MAG: hypothetical protein JWL61_2582 [Gemmatimonadetes bacterium]|jgi:hypothetical protein|nr:hypothetical protein [Gemmatimonadota bacterium]